MPGEEITSAMDVLSLEDMSGDKVVVPALRTSSDCSRGLRWLLCYAFDSICVTQLLSLGQERPYIWLTLTLQEVTNNTPFSPYSNILECTFLCIRTSMKGYMET